MKKTYLKILTVTISAIILASCPQPLTRSVMENARDEINPVITIQSPIEYSSFGRTLQIQGIVSDLSNESGIPGKVESLRWEILSQTASSDVSINTDGSFLIESDTNLKENIVIRLTAVDWNGNSSESRLPLVYEGNDIPSLSITPGNREVELSWDDVPGVDTYTLFMEASSQAPTVNSLIKVPGISSPYTMKNLKDGTIYSFLLQGTSDSGPENFSSIVRAIPLSRYHLFPRIESTYNYISLEWQTLNGIDSYEVMRSENPGGPFTGISGPVTGNSFNDGNVQQEEVYYYAVKPFEYCDIISEASEGRLEPFPPIKNAEVAHYMTPQNPQNSVVKGNYLFIADGDRGLHIADISSPSVPIPITTLSIANGVHDLVISGNTIYATNGRDKMFVIDITDPAQPSITGSVVITNSQAEGIDLEGNIVAVSCFNDGFSLVNVSDPANPVLTYHENQSGGIYPLGQVHNAELETIGTNLYLFISENNSSLIYKITGSDSSPVLNGISEFKDGVSKVGSNEISITEDGQYAYLANSSELYCYSITSIASPTKISSLYVGGTGGVVGVSLEGNRAFTAHRLDTGFTVIDISNPAAISKKNVYMTPGEIKGITVQNGYVFLSEGRDYGLQIFGVAEPESPSLLYTYNLIEPTDLAIQGDYLFITDNYLNQKWRMEVLDISTPDNPVTVGGTDDYNPVRMRIVGQKIFLTAHENGSLMYNINNPENPHSFGWYNAFSSYADYIDIQGQYATVITSDQKLHVVDVSWPDSFFNVSTLSLSTGNAITDIIYRNNYAFISKSAEGLIIVDLTDPKWPDKIDTVLPYPGVATGLDIYDDKAYVSDNSAGLYIYDISNPSQINELGRLGTARDAKDVVVRGDYAVLALGSSGIEVINISDPNSLQSVLSYSGINADRILMADNLLYVLDTTGGKLNILDLMP